MSKEERESEDDIEEAGAGRKYESWLEHENAHC